MERERHRQHSPATPHKDADSPQLPAPAHLQTRGPAREPNGPSSSAATTPSSTPSTPGATPTNTTATITATSTPSTPVNGGPEGGTRDVPGPGAYESPDPENGSEFCVAENEQTEADQATAAAAQSKS